MADDKPWRKKDPLLKRLGRHPRIRAAGAWIVMQYVLFVHATTRWVSVDRGSLEAMVTENKPFIMVFWHGRLTMIPFVRTKTGRYNLLLSRHSDASYLLKMTEYFDVGVVYGSTAKARRAGRADKGGAAALLTLARILKGGEIVALAPDGPRGPVMEAQPGVIALARLTGAPIVPVSWSTSRRRVFGTWDRFVFPYPFGRGAVCCGEPMRIPSDARTEDFDQYARLLEAKIDEVTAEADRHVGVEPVIGGHAARLAPADADRKVA